MRRDDGRGEEAGLGETLEFMRLLWSVDHALQRRSKRMDRALGITGPQRLVIRVVGSRPGVSAGEVARTLKVHPSTLTGILKRLQQRKIVRRVSDPKDARRVFLHLDGLGATLNAARVGTIEEAVERALTKVGPPRLAAARRVLEALVRELEEGLPAESAASSTSLERRGAGRRS